MNNNIQLCGDIWQKLVKQYPDHKLTALRKMLQEQLQKHYHITLCDSTIINYLSQYRNCNTRLPKTWKEFCQSHPVRKGESYQYGNKIIIVNYTPDCRYIDSTEYWPNERYAKAVLALAQLIQLRDCYNQGWQPDWKNDRESKYVISFYNEEIDVCKVLKFRHTLAFKNKQLLDQFITNFKELIEIAKPLL